MMAPKINTEIVIHGVNPTKLLNLGELLGVNPMLLPSKTKYIQAWISPNGITQDKPEGQAVAVYWFEGETNESSTTA